MTEEIKLPGTPGSEEKPVEKPADKKPAEDGMPEENKPEAGADGQEADPEEKPTRAAKRIDRLTALYREEQRRNEELAARLESVEKRITDRRDPDRPEEDELPEKPKRTAFETEEEYEDAREAWRDKRADIRTKKAVADATKNLRMETQRQNMTEEDRRLMSEWDVKEEKTRKEIEDYDEVMEHERLMLPKELMRKARASMDAVLQADNGPRISYHLMTHQDELERIAKLHPARQFVEIGALGERLKAADKVKKNKAPDISGTLKDKTPSGNSAGGKIDWEKLTNKEHMDARAAGHRPW